LSKIEECLGARRATAARRRAAAFAGRLDLVLVGAACDGPRAPAAVYLRALRAACAVDGAPCPVDAPEPAEADGGEAARVHCQVFRRADTADDRRGRLLEAVLVLGAGFRLEAADGRVLPAAASSSARVEGASSMRS